MRINVKPLTHWIIYKGYTVRFTKRTPREVTGVLRTSANAEIPFTYDPQSLTVRLPDMRIIINEHGWELDKKGTTNDNDTREEENNTSNSSPQNRQPK